MDEYYKKRAPYYDRVYLYPERKKDLAFLREYIPGKLEGLNVIEIAAGTGFWTQYICEKAISVLATDVIQEPLDEILKRELPISVNTATADAFDLPKFSELFNGAFVGLFLSHVRIEEVNKFFDSLHRVLSSNAKVVFLDNTTSQCERLPITRTDELGNSYQERQLDDGSTHEVLKNFPSKEQLHKYVEDVAVNISYKELDHFWLLEYEYSG